MVIVYSGGSGIRNFSRPGIGQFTLDYRSSDLPIELRYLAEGQADKFDYVVTIREPTTSVTLRLGDLEAKSFVEPTMWEMLWQFSRRNAGQPIALAGALRLGFV